ncbi:MAG: hypothetical protein M1831_005109 [Alyxoria varia]|nr:MAG: hypothetical protein M1831_005109 [Alyxoria varia]
MEASVATERKKQAFQKSDLAREHPDKSWGRMDQPSRKAPMTFFLKSEEEMEDSGSSNPIGTPSNSTYGVHSLDPGIEATPSLTHDGSPQGTKGNTSTKSNDPIASNTLEPAPKASNSNSARESPTRASGERDEFSTARGLPFPTPTSLVSHSPGTDSVPISTPKSPTSLRSLRLSDEDDVSADEHFGQTISTGKSMQDTATRIEPIVQDAQDAPQLVMPTMDIPRRRPFTEKGKHMGKLKTMVAGTRNSGKTSLIKSIVQACEDIVHVDPLSSSQIKLVASQSQSQHLHLESNSGISTIGASTRPYPPWWSETKEPSPLTRRKSNNESILERNISFIDTPGFDDLSSFNANTSSIFQYLEGLLHCNASFASLSDGELLSIFSGNGGVQVDLVLYIMNMDPLVDPKLRDMEWSFLRRLCEITNVIPIVGKSDLYPSESFTDFKDSCSGDLWAKGIKPFHLSPQILQSESHEDTTPNFADIVYAISSAHSDDDDNMDASLLMSPDYVKPLISSDLQHLISAIFNPDTTSRLRHAAAQKFINWSRDGSSSEPPSMSVHTLRPNLRRSVDGKFAGESARPAKNNSTVAATAQNLSSSPPSSPFAMARISDHKQREERLAQVHLARWASDLQRAMRNERQRFVELQQAERTSWLRERLRECADMEGRALLQDADSVFAGEHDSQPWHKTKAFSSNAQTTYINPQDPLGLLEWRRQVRQRAAMLAKVLSGMGIVGAIFVWAMRSSEDSSSSGWAPLWLKDLLGE